jgi:hypothetical protein
MPHAYSPRRGLHLGSDLETRTPLWLDDRWLRTGLHVLGRTGCGKSKLALHFFAQLAADDRATTILLSPKGDLGPAARDYAIEHGLSKRLVVFDPADRNNIIGYNPLKPNGSVDPYVQAHLVRQAILAAHGQSSVDRTQQLGRMLTIVLSAARLLELTFLEACELLRADSTIRSTVLTQITDAVLARALAYFDQLRAQRQDELAASALARLEAFTTFPILREIVSQQAHSLDLAEIMRERKILIINLEVFNPLPLDDVRALGRLLINDILAHAFARPKGARTPVRVIIDECELFATETLCFALNMGRELGLVPVLLHQELEQLTLDDDSRKLYAAVMNDTLAKIVSGSTTIEDLKKLADTLFLHDFDPKSVKDELTSLEVEPFADWAKSYTYTTNWGRSSSSTAGRSRSRGIANSRTRSQASTDAHGMTFTKAHAVAESAGTIDGQSVLSDADGNAVMIPTQSTTHGSSEIYTTGVSETDTHAETDGEAESEAWNHQQGETSSEQEGTQDGGSLSVTLAPTIAHEKRRVVSSRTFWTYDEHILKNLQAAGRLGVGEFIIKVPGKAARAVRAPFVRDPFVPARQRTAALERMHALPYYSRPAEIALEAEQRHQRLLPMPTSPPRRQQRSNPTWDFALPTTKK